MVLMVRHAVVGVFQNRGVGKSRSLKSGKGQLDNAPVSDWQLQEELVE